MSYFGGSSGMVGDPGFFDSLKKIVGGAVRFGAGVLAGSPGGRIVTAGRQAIFQRPSARIHPAIVEIGTGIAIGAGTALAERALAGPCPPGQACPSGHHLNKSSYFLMDGTFVAEGSRCVRNRTRNPYNRRAATRAASRLKSLGSGLRTIKKSVGQASRGLGNKG